MEYAGLGLVALVLLGGAWFLARLLGRSARNDGGDHGGGYNGTPPDVL